MEINNFKNKAVTEIKILIATFGMGDKFNVSFGEIFSHSDDHHEHISGSVEVGFNYGNCKREHIINVAWDESGGFGLEGVDGEVSTLTFSGVLGSMYLDLALVDLSDEFLV